MLRYLTAGESHGKCLTTIIEGMPSNVPIAVEQINALLKKRQLGYGRGNRMNIEDDKVEALSGIRNGKTLGSPICLQIINKDWENSKNIMDVESVIEDKPITIPRPGHADLAGAIKYNQTDIRNILERSSARETAIRTAVGSIAMQLLDQLGIKVYSRVVQIGWIKSDIKFTKNSEFLNVIDNSPLRCGDETAEKEMMKIIDEAKVNGDSLGGIIEVVGTGMPIGLGSCMHWDRKLDAKIAYALMSVQGIKGVEFGSGFEASSKLGSQVQDEITYENDKFLRKTNNAGGIEGGMSNGENIVVRAAMKPIPTLYKPLDSVDILTKEQVKASVIRSDVCAVPAVSIVAQAVAAWEIASAFLEKFGGDSLEEIIMNYSNYLYELKKS